MGSNKEAMVRKLGGEAEYRAWLVAKGAKGGKAQVSKGFAKMDAKKHAEVSLRGGLVSSGKKRNEKN